MIQAADLTILRAFAAVAREGNVSRAAERLHLSQPAVSLQLKRLAEITGLTGYEVLGSGLGSEVAPTALGPDAVVVGTTDAGTLQLTVSDLPKPEGATKSPGVEFRMRGAALNSQ